MTLNDFKIRISELTERKYKPRTRKLRVGAPTERTLFSFNLEWEGLLEGHDPLNPASYLGAEHRGCMFYTAGDELTWGFAKMTTARGHQIIPSKPNKGLHDIVLTALSDRKEAQVLRDEIAAMNPIPDPEKPILDREYVVIS